MNILQLSGLGLEQFLLETWDQGDPRKVPSVSQQYAGNLQIMWNKSPYGFNFLHSANFALCTDLPCSKLLLYRNTSEQREEKQSKTK